MCFSDVNQLIQSPCFKAPVLYLASTFQEAVFLCPNHPRPGTRQPKTAPAPQSLFKVLLCLAFPTEIIIKAFWARDVALGSVHVKTLVLAFPWHLLPHNSPWCFLAPYMVWWVPPPGNYKKLTFQWQLCPDLSAQMKSRGILLETHLGSTLVLPNQVV